MKFAILLVLAGLLITFTLIEANTSNDHHHSAKHSAAKAVEQGDHKQHAKKGKSEHHHETGAKGQSDKIKHKIDDEEKGGKKKSYHVTGHHQDAHKDEGHTSHGAKHNSAAKHKKTNFSKGFREQYHKDEHKKHDSFYTHGNKMGQYKIFNSKNSKFYSYHHDKDAKGKYLSGKRSGKYQKSSKKSKKNDKHQEKKPEAHQIRTPRSHHTKH